MKKSRKEEMLFTRKTIIEKATSLFMTQGYKQTSTREIAIASGITQPALYHHFKDKETLYVEVIKELTTNVKESLDKLLSCKNYDERLLSEMIETLIVLHPTNILLMIHDIMSDLKPENQTLLYKLCLQTYNQPFEIFFQKLKDEGRLRHSIEVKTAARYVISSITPLFGPEPKFNVQNKTERIAELTDIFLHGLCTD
ncbi:TetR/AcrR family transcriptional regulator [Vagococcus intermedius]|uniref:TetR/AcrR family transcriptional regulator n=1 Tax=Vagococcus intermedius TaxID=2991418 RepID=A0AAF0I8D2_9ENTE|nr:TetR/AcrR family transcriptional regulator [Vagococcus intermedius]WEG72422.1 TetR/AcrR family transcriptional regulator [Vagococcus intermedius]WEG74509.1 TetR/AcrR family transcriptional regulator [Vagococcus intermedius]